MGTSKTEARIVRENSILLALSGVEEASAIEHFCGVVLTAADLAAGSLSLRGKSVYLCGDMANASDVEPSLRTAARVFVVRELSRNEDRVSWPIVGAGRVPRLVHDAGVLVPAFFDPERDHFNTLREEHAFQSLTESNKPGKAHRTGIYLTPVERDGDALRFRLLRCSSNFSGPTENFRAHDRTLVDALNLEAAFLFENPARLNHVLAQIYWNTPGTATTKPIKAKIKGHADKTKDMPHNAIMAFCTFYDSLEGLQPSAKDPFDFGHRRASALTRLTFRLKPQVASRPGCSLKEHFSVTLYPNSAFFMPLSTNRLYTHEIRPSQLSAEHVPTRLGYVVRSSSQAAVYRDGRTMIEVHGQMVDLQPPTPEGMSELRRLYAEENRTDAPIDYGDRFLFSMNTGDYAKPEFD